MKHKRLLVIVAALLSVFAATMLVHPYPRQLLLGPTIQEIPLCVWQQYFRTRHSQAKPDNSLMAQMLRWLQKSREDLPWSILSHDDRDILFASLVGDFDPNVRKGIAVEIGYTRSSLGLSQAQIDTLLILLDDSDASVVEQACQRIGDGRFYELASPKFTALLDHANPAHRVVAIRAIAASDYPVTTTYKETIKRLVHMLTDSDSSVRLAALEAPRWSRRRSIQFAIAPLRERLADPDPRCRVAAAKALRLVSGHTKDVWAAYRAALRDADPAVRKAALESMRADKDMCLAAWDEIAGCALHDKDGSVRAAAVTALHHGGPKAVPLIRVLLRDPACYPGALELIKRLGPDAKGYAPDVLAALPGIGHEGYQILGAIKAKEALPFLLKKLNEEEDDSAVLWRAIDALVNYGPDAMGAAPRLWKLAENPEKETRQAALAALARIQADPPRLVPLLLKLLDSEDRSAIEDALTALDYLGPHASDAVPALTRALRGPYHFKRQGAAMTLGNIGAAASIAIPDMLPLLRLQSDHVQDKIIVVEALAQIGLEHAKWASALVPLLDEAFYYPFLRLKVIQALARCGPEARAAIPALTNLLDDDDLELAEAAAAALTAIDPVRYPKTNE